MCKVDRPRHVAGVLSPAAGGGHPGVGRGNGRGRGVAEEPTG